jgi:hypothetical protein
MQAPSMVTHTRDNNYISNKIIIWHRKRTLGFNWKIGLCQSAAKSFAIVCEIYIVHLILSTQIQVWSYSVTIRKYF